MFSQGFNTRSVTFNLILINVLVFLATRVWGEQLYAWLALFYPASPYFKPSQIIGHMFMHANFMHIFSNMFALFMFGAILERVWGPQRFLIFYFITGLGAAALHTGVQALIIHNFTGSFAPALSVVSNYPQVAAMYGDPTVGASGAIFGVLVAFGMLFPNTELMLIFFPIPIKAKYFVGIYVIWELYRGIAMDPTDNVAHFAHLGGALFGFLLVKYWNRHSDYLY
jgi:membrane associated rhomboid family serine protease